MKRTILAVCCAGIMLLGGVSVSAAEPAAIAYPAGEVTDYFGYVCYNFEIDGAKAFIVAPKVPPAEGTPWLWCLAWPDAFWPQLPAKALLDQGWHYVYLECNGHWMSPAGIKQAEKFYAKLQELHFAPKGALMGMSRGGLFSLLWTAQHPETVSCIYLDAPACTFTYKPQVTAMYESVYGVKGEAALDQHPLAPVNNVAPIAKAKIPILLIRHGQDQTLNPATNSDLFAERYRAAGGSIQVEDLSFYGHHPHGLYDPQPLVDFILRNSR